jgi:hypothetical protein
MRMLSRLSLLGFATAAACSYDANQLAGPPEGEVDGAISGIDGARTRDVGTSSAIVIDAPATGGVGGATGTGGTASSRLDAAAVEIGGKGGTLSTGGTTLTGSGGVVNSGGVTSTGAVGTPLADAGLFPSPDGGNCISKVINNGYACGTAPACSTCKDNNTSLEASCKAVLDCFESKYPCTGNCATECFNSTGAIGPVRTCITALQTAACSGTGGC